MRLPLTGSGLRAPRKALVPLVLAASLLPAPASAAPPGWETVKTSELPGDDELIAVAATGPKSAWALGTRTSTDGEQVDLLAYHWDGRSWQRSKLPAGLGYGGIVPALDAAPGAGAWALAPCGAIWSGAPCRRDSTTVLRWTGKEWKATTDRKSVV